MNPLFRRARSLLLLCAVLALPVPAVASTSFDCIGPASGKIVVQVHATMDFTHENDSVGWWDIDVKINDQWLNFPRTLRSATSPSVLPETPDDFVGTKILKPPITALRVLDEGRKVVLEVTLDTITVTDDEAFYTGRATVSWKGRHIKDAVVKCEEPG